MLTSWSTSIGNYCWHYRWVPSEVVVVVVVVVVAVVVIVVVVVVVVVEVADFAIHKSRAI